MGSICVIEEGDRVIHINGDPNMPEETLQKLLEVFRLAAQEAEEVEAEKHGE